LAADWKLWEPKGGGQPSVKIDRGYDVHTTNHSPKKGANGLLRDPVDRTQIYLFIEEIETDLSLSGSTGQGLHTRDFYPHNFVQPNYTLRCQAPGQREYGRVAEFVRKAQRNCLVRNTRMALLVPGSRWPLVKHMKGPRKPFYAFGYVTSMPRIHRAHDPAPSYEIQFLIAQVRSGIFQDTPYTAYKLARWSDIVDNIISKNLVSPPHVEKPSRPEDDDFALQPGLPTISNQAPPNLSEDPPVDLVNP
jgi:hypothetical protein